MTYYKKSFLPLTSALKICLIEGFLTFKGRPRLFCQSFCPLRFILISFFKTRHPDGALTFCIVLLSGFKREHTRRDVFLQKLWNCYLTFEAVWLVQVLLLSDLFATEACHRRFQVPEFNSIEADRDSPSCGDSIR